MTRTAVITGAAGGLGSATVARLVACGWRVVAADLDSPALHALAGESVTPVVCDVTDGRSVELLAAAAARVTDGLDALVTFAGIVGIGPMVEMLRRELALVGVSVVKLQPGAFRTGMVASIMSRFERLAAESEHYQRVLLAARKRVPQEEKRAGDPSDLAALVERVLDADRPKASYRINTNPRAAALSRLPTPVLDKLLHAALKRA